MCANDTAFLLLPMRSMPIWYVRNRKLSKYVYNFNDRCFQVALSISLVQCPKMCLFYHVVAQLNVIFVLVGGQAGSLCMIVIIYLKVRTVCIVVCSFTLQSFVESVRPGLLDLSSRILGPNSVIQAAIPDILANTPQKYFDDIMSQILVITKLIILFIIFILYDVEQRYRMLSNFV